MQNVVSSARNAKKKNHWVFLEITNVLWICRSAFCVFPVSSHRILKWSMLKNKDLIKLIIFTSSSRTFLRKISFVLFNYECMAVKNMINTSMFGANAIYYPLKYPPFYPPMLYCHQSKCQSCGKGKKLILQWK